MRDFYLAIRRIRLILFLAVFLASLYDGGLFAQTRPVRSGAIRIQVSESMAASLESARMSRSADNTLRTGITALDDVNAEHKVTNLRRVFPNAGKFEAKHRKYGLHLWYEVVMDKGVSVDAAVGRYKRIADVQKAEVIYEKKMIGDSKPVGPRIASAPVTLTGGTNDPMFGQQWHYDNTGQNDGTPHADIRLLKAWGIETGKRSVVVAITDGGVDFNHQDLKANAWVNSGEVAGNGIDDDKNGYVDDVHGYNFLYNKGTIDAVSHGTHVAGTIAASTNNGIGVSGVAGGTGSGDGVSIMSCQVFDDDENADGFAQTYVYAADNGAVISQNSWGYTKPGIYEDAVLEAIDYFIAEAGTDANGNQTGPMRGGIVIFAAGNNASGSSYYPGYYEPVLSVGSITNRDLSAYYTNYGSSVDISAPGGETIEVTERGVLSTLPGNTYGFYQGTSMACPHVSGVAALVVSKFGGAGFTAAQLRDKLVNSVDYIDDINTGFAGAMGSGRVNAFSALQADDHAGPDAITDLAATTVRSKTLTLTFTAPGDAGNGMAYRYEIRYATTPITEANIGSATLLAGVHQAKEAGERESIAISDLYSNTTYYFVVRSRDVPGNESALSNIAVQATYPPPVVALSDASVSASLLTAQTTEKQFSIINTGLGPLDFSVARDPYQTDFAKFEPATGTVAPGESQVVNVTFDAHRLFGGEYGQTLTITSNDTVSTSVQLPLTLTVINNDAPIVTFDPATHDFGGVYAGIKKNKTINFFNEGSDTLRITSVVSTDARFTSDFKKTIKVPPFHAGRLTLTYAPTATTASTGTIYIGNNDPKKSLLSVAVSGHGVVPPAMTVSPTTLSVAVPTAGTVQKNIFVSSTGQSDLVYAVHAIPGKSDVAFSQQLTFTPSASSATATSSAKQKYTGAPPAGTQTVTIRSARESSKPVRVLIVSPDYSVGDFSRLMAGFKDLYVRPLAPEYLPNINAESISAYNVVIVTNNSSWDTYTTAAAVGDLLADYVDAGGKVIIGNFAYGDDSYYDLKGRFITEHYGPFQRAINSSSGTPSLGEILQPAHPLVEGVSELSYDGYVYDVGLTDGSTALARWSSGELLMAANNNVVAFNLLASANDYFPWKGDLATLYHNAIHWLAGTPSMVITPTSGTIASGGQQALSVTFDGTDLDNGTYSNVVYLSTDVPGKELFQVPATLTVRGPDFSIKEDSILAYVDKGAKLTRTITLTNNGEDAHNYTVRATASSIVPPQSVINGVSASEPESVPVVTRTGPATGPKQDPASVAYQVLKPAAGTTAAEARTASADGSYFTDFESYVRGDISLAPDGWIGQYGNWVTGTTNPFSGLKQLRGVADGYGASLAQSPLYLYHTQPYSTLSLQANLSHAAGVSWQLVPFSYWTQQVATRLLFDSDGAVYALVNVGSDQPEWAPIEVDVPSGYFAITIEVDRSNGNFRILFDNEAVFTGKGFATEIDGVSISSLMEEAGPYIDIDDVSLIDGKKEPLPEYLTVSTSSGKLAAGASKVITLTVDAAELTYGTYQSEVLVDVERVQVLTLPVLTDVIGAAAVVADAVPTVQASYAIDTLTTFAIHNTGGTVLDYKLKLAGADTTWLSLSTHSGLLAKRDSVVVTIDYASKALVPGTYTAQILLQSNVEATPVITLPVTLHVLKPAVIAFTPSPVSATVATQHTVQQTVQIKNTGVSPLTFAFNKLFTADAIKAAYGKDMPVRDDVSVLYATGFEEFEDWGALEGQQGWTTTGGEWQIFSNMPDENGYSDYYLESDARVDETSTAYSPVVAKGVQPMSSALITVNLEDVRPVHGMWQIVPQSASGAYVTKIQLRSRKIEVLSRNAAGEEVFTTVPFTMEEYDDVVLRVDVERATGLFTFYVNNEPLFHGQGSGGDIEQIAIVAGSYRSDWLEIDDVMILDGVLPWLNVSPAAGKVASGESLDITVTLDAQSLAAGSYTDALYVASNDPAVGLLTVPVTLTVTGVPLFAVDKNSLEVTINRGTTKQTPLAISNKGAGAGNYHFSIATPAATGRMEGPDSGSYFWTDSDEPNGPAFDWIDISATGTPQGMVDNDMRKITLPFPFPFYGKSYTEIYVKADGLFGFGLQYYPEDDSNVGIPSVRNEPDNYFTPFWDYLSPGEGGEIYVLKAADKFIVQFDDVPVYGDDEPGNTFQVIMYPDGRIKYQYLSTVGSLKATVGIENATGDDGLQIAFNEAYLKDNLAVLISPSPSWATPSVLSGGLAAGASSNVNVTFDATNLSAGTYHSYLFIHTDDWATPLVSIPVSMTVQPAYKVSGTVTTAASTALAGVTITGFPETVVTDAAGTYTTVVPVNWSGTIKPSLAGYTFTPDQKVIAAVNSDVADANFTGAVVTGIEQGQRMVRAYPNPSEGTFRFALTSTSDIHVEVYTTTGERVLEADPKKEDGEYVVHVTRKGLFVLVVRSKEAVYTERIVVR